VVTEPEKQQIRLNGQQVSLVAPTVTALLGSMEIDPSQSGIAVALNGSVIPRAAWAQTPLHPGDSVEVVRARQGG
jgi:sulfur carrier protein